MFILNEIRIIEFRMYVAYGLLSADSPKSFAPRNYGDMTIIRSV